jgi:DNA replication protein DnaC
MPDHTMHSMIRHCEKHGDFDLYYHGKCEGCAAEERERRAQIERQEREDALRAYSRIPARFAGKGFDTYRPRTRRQAQVLLACRKYASEPRAACVTLIGPPGVGKTHLLCAIADHMIAHHLLAARYITTGDALAACRGNWAWHGQDEKVQKLATVDVLVLDEVTHPLHERDREAAGALIDARYRENRPTLLASNLTPNELREALGARPFDRLHDDGGQVLALDGTSYRSNA